MRSECANCGRKFKETERIVATTLGNITEDTFSMDIDEPWQDLLCMDCQNAGKPKQPLVDIKITVEGGVIQAISGIPTEGTVTIYDYDTEGVDIEDLTRIKVRPDNPEDNEYQEVLVSKWHGSVQVG